jgi:protein-disulfide isomerase
LHAKDAGVNRKQMLEELVNSTYGQNVHDDIAYGKKLGVTEIPTFFINGEKYSGKLTFEGLSKEIEEALKKVKPKKAAK